MPRPVLLRSPLPSKAQHLPLMSAVECYHNLLAWTRDDAPRIRALGRGQAMLAVTDKLPEMRAAGWHICEQVLGARFPSEIDAHAKAGYLEIKDVLQKSLCE